MTQPAFETTATALREKSKLQRHFRRFDVFFYLICTVVTIDTIGAVASNGPVHLLIFSASCSSSRTRCPSPSCPRRRARR